LGKFTQLLRFFFVVVKTTVRHFFVAVVPSTFASKKIEKQINTEKIEPVIVVNLIPGLIVGTESERETKRECVLE